MYDQETDYYLCDECGFLTRNICDEHGGAVAPGCEEPKPALTLALIDELLGVEE